MLFKEDRLNDEHRLQELLASRKQATQADRITLKLTEASENLRSNLATESQTYDLKMKRTLFEALHLEVLADPKTYKFNFKLGVDIISTSDTDQEADFNQLIKVFEQQHPETSVEDLLDFNKNLPEDTPFGRVVNNLKNLKRNLVTTART